MGFSPGEFVTADKDGAAAVHWEGRAHQIILWDAGETKPLLRLAKSEARKALDQLSLLVDMLEEDRL